MIIMEVTPFQTGILKYKKEFEHPLRQKIHNIPKSKISEKYRIKLSVHCT